MNIAKQTIATEAPRAEGVSTSLLAAPSSRQRAWHDVRQGLQNWRVWWLLGMGDIRQRYRRSRVGQFWITLSQAIFIVSIGILYSTLFKQPISTYLPYLAITFTVWSLISGIITDSTTAFVQAESFLRQQAMPKTTFIMRVLLRNFLTFAHNIIIIPAVFLYFGISVSWTVLLGLAGLIVISIAGGLAGLVCAILCTRFRDLPQIVQNVIQVAFFLSPVTWQPELMGEKGRYFIAFNPFAAFLQLVTEPMLGRVPSLMVYASAGIYLSLLAVIAWALLTRFRQRIVYWL
jgi:ABC-type polysaccharide/polyol phosphate export permease